MNSSDEGTFLENIAFLQRLFEILTGISVLFPLSNKLVKVIPLAQKIDTPTYEYINPEMVTYISTLISLFFILWTFLEFKTEVDLRKMQRQAGYSFVIGLLALVIYIVLFYGIYTIFYAPFGINSGEPGRLIGDIALLFSYSVLFACLTRTFMILGMSLRKKEKLKIVNM